MQKRKLGQNGPLVSAIGMGAMNLSYGTGKATETQEAVNVLHAAIDQGINFFDTAEAYGPYTNETLLGKAFSSVARDSIIIASKFGFKIENNAIAGVDSRPETIRAAVEASLMRLNTDYIDIYYQHRQDPSVPVEEVAGTMKMLIEEGKIRHYGLSEVGDATIRRAHAVHPVTAIQNQYSVWTREPEAEVLPLCESLGIGFVPWGTLGTGFLTGNIDENTTFDSETDLRAGFPRFTPEAMKANRPVVDMLKHVAAEKGASPVQIALAWLLAQKPWIVPIPGMDKKAYLSDNIKSADITLTSSDLAYIDDELARMTIQGARLNEDLLALSE